MIPISQQIIVLVGNNTQSRFCTSTPLPFCYICEYTSEELAKLVWSVPYVNVRLYFVSLLGAISLDSRIVVSLAVRVRGPRAFRAAEFSPSQAGLCVNRSWALDLCGWAEPQPRKNSPQDNQQESKNSSQLICCIRLTPKLSTEFLLPWVLCFLIHFILNCFEVKPCCSFEELGLGCCWDDIQKKPPVFLKEGLSKG